jgi:hypothetical protein
MLDVHLFLGASQKLEDEPSSFVTTCVILKLSKELVVNLCFAQLYFQ